mgnify:CR=1 FL=1
MNDLITTSPDNSLPAATQSGRQVDQKEVLTLVKALQELRASGYTGVQVAYSGCGDSGGVDGVAVRNHAHQWTEVDFENNEWQATADLVDAFHDGFENNDGGSGIQEILLDDQGAWTHNIINAVYTEEVLGSTEDSSDLMSAPLPERFIALVENYEGSQIRVSGSGGGDSGDVDNIELDVPFANSQAEALGEIAETLIASGPYRGYENNSGGEWAITFSATTDEQGVKTWALTQADLQYREEQDCDAQVIPLAPTDYVAEFISALPQNTPIQVAFAEFMEQRVSPIAEEVGQPHKQGLAMATVAEIDAWYQRYAPIPAKTVMLEHDVTLFLGDGT